MTAYREPECYAIRISLRTTAVKGVFHDALSSYCKSTDFCVGKQRKGKSGLFINTIHIGYSEKVRGKQIFQCLHELVFKFSETDERVITGFKLPSCAKIKKNSDPFTNASKNAHKTRFSHWTSKHQIRSHQSGFTDFSLACATALHSC